jgi:trehalose 6-phosphate phosphatase
MEVIGKEQAQALARRLNNGSRAWLILDYDGTLADFAPTPDAVLPDVELISLVERLSLFPQILRLVVLSGRTVSQIRRLVPIPGVLLAGTYGVEYLNWEGDEVRLLELDTFRPHLDRVKHDWEETISGRNGFYLEDKGYTIALHSKNAAREDAYAVMAAAQRIAHDADLPEILQISHGDMFLEVSHEAASKGKSLEMLLDRFIWPGAEIFFFGDSEQDEPAFKAARSHGGTTVLISNQNHRETQARFLMESPREVRLWLETLAEGLETRYDG